MLLSAPAFYRWLEGGWIVFNILVIIVVVRDANANANIANVT